MDEPIAAEIEVIEMTPEEMEAFIVEEQQKKREAKERFAAAILHKRDEAIAFRSATGIERQWRAAEELLSITGYEDVATKYSMLDAAQGITPRRQNGPQRSTVVMNVVRGRCDTAIGRFSDIMLPVDDKNWALKPTPMPKMKKMLQDQRPAMQQGKPITDARGQQAKISDVANDINARVHEAMALMETEIEDQLVECDYNGECRKLIADAVRLGTGIIKGPTVSRKAKKRWMKRQGDTGVTAYVIDECEDYAPSSKCVSPWNVYPSADCIDDISASSYIWERDYIRTRDAYALIGLPGYDEEQIRLALSTPPRITSVSESGKVQAFTAEKDRPYEIWEYHGDVSREDMALLSECEVEHDVVSACVIFLNDIPVKADVNPLETGDLPYCAFTWSKEADTPWGYGIPMQMVWPQRVLNGAWRAMMDNAGNSAGVNAIVGEGIEPEDGKWVVTGNKIWRTTVDAQVEDVRKAFTQFQIANNQQAMQQIIEMTLRFVDMETSIPTIFQAEAQKAPDTLGATNIMVDAANITFRSRAKLFDDCITRPHLKMYYDWNMQNNDKEEIKGDFNVDPRGVSVLYERDQQAQLLLQTFQLKGDPDVASAVDWKKAVKQFFASRRLDVMKSDEEIEQQQQAMQQQPQQQAPNPNLEVAQVRVQGELEKAQLVQQSDMAELRFKAEQAELDRQHERAMKEMDTQMRMMEYAEKHKIEIDKLKVQLSLSSAGMNLQKELSEKRTVNPQISEPPTEPAGQARPGTAYEA